MYITNPDNSKEGTPVLRLITERSAFDALEREWRALFDVSPGASPTMRWEWMHEWWRVYGERYGASESSLRIFTLTNSNGTSAILPLYLRKGSPQRLCFLGSGEDPEEATYGEYLNMLCRPEVLEQALDTFGAAIFGERNIAWNSLHLGIMPADSPLHAWLKKHSAHSLFFRQVPHEAYIADLSGGFDNYLERLSANSRQQYRRLLKEADKPEFRFSIAASTEETLSYMNELITLHQARWTAVGKLGAFHSERMKDFHRSLISSLVPGKDFILARLTHGEATVSLIYGFLHRQKFDFYQSGVVSQNSAPLKSAGIVTHLLTMRYLAGLGMTQYDLLSGPAEYKSRFATQTNLLTESILQRPSLRSIAAALVRSIRALR